MNVKRPQRRCRGRRDTRSARADFEAAADADQRRHEGRHPGRPRRAGRARRGAGTGRASCGAPVIKALLGKAVVPDDSPYTTGGIGLLGHGAVAGRACRNATPSSWPARSFPVYRVPAQAGPGEGACRSISTRRASACAARPTSAWSATAQRVLELLLPFSTSKNDRGFLEKAQDGMEAWNKLMERARHADGQADEAAGRHARS